jgi:hypothetical protein
MSRSGGSGRYRNRYVRNPVHRDAPKATTRDFHSFFATPASPLKAKKKPQAAKKIVERTIMTTKQGSMAPMGTVIVSM